MPAVTFAGRACSALRERMAGPVPPGSRAGLPRPPPQGPSSPGESDRQRLAAAPGTASRKASARSVPASQASPVHERASFAPTSLRRDRVRESSPTHSFPQSNKPKKTYIKNTPIAKAARVNSPRSNPSSVPGRLPSVGLWRSRRSPTATRPSRNPTRVLITSGMAPNNFMPLSPTHQIAIPQGREREPCTNALLRLPSSYTPGQPKFSCVGPEYIAGELGTARLCACDLLDQDCH
jgi:hypothetical protein